MCVIILWLFHSLPLGKRTIDRKINQKWPGFAYVHGGLGYVLENPPALG